jgi:iron(II)-dependent oxidoreductase
VAPSPSSSPPLEGAEPLLEERLRGLLAEARERTLALVAPVSEADLDTVHDPLMSPLAWDLGHIAAFEDLWLCQRAGGLPALREELSQVYDAAQTPRADRGSLPYLRAREALGYLEAVRERALGVLVRVDLSPQGDRLNANGFVWEMLVEHEHQHNETMLQTLQIARPGTYAPQRRSLPRPPAPVSDGTVRVAGGRVTLGAPADGFAYDNERPRHSVELSPFEIDRVPVTAGRYRAWMEDGGYGRREWWSEEGWRWRQAEGAERPRYWTADGGERSFERVEEIDPELPVSGVCWFEADAFARAHGMRLPTEAEWEAAATWDPVAGRALARPWGDEPAGPLHANLDQLGFGPAAAGAYAAGASPCGALGMVGDVWEWTASGFAPYPGFRPFPYPEYSEVFFGAGYRVLRGGSWATRPRVARGSFRNWDHPQRRQIFAGFRCARDA